MHAQKPPHSVFLAAANGNAVLPNHRYQYPNGPHGPCDIKLVWLCPAGIVHVIFVLRFCAGKVARAAARKRGLVLPIHLQEWSVSAWETLTKNFSVSKRPVTWQNVCEQLFRHQSYISCGRAMLLGAHGSTCVCRVSCFLDIPVAAHSSAPDSCASEQTDGWLDRNLSL